ncbi:glycosyltransferase [uncultured Jannaschia sp.]|uniref:glycosyltransferase n=1 Tax=uncultured Jannaschia sp. TaxID=293347 RepID=UPI0026314ADA|nr:glycosyltransferase [uncultured Jannaschia sp.]
MIREAAFVIAECPRDSDDLIELHGADPARIREVSCGVEPASFAPVPRAVARAVLGLPEDGFLALQLGQMVPRKGVDDAIRAVARCRAAGMPDMRLMVVGGIGPRPDPAVDPELARLMGVAAEEGAADAVDFAVARPGDLLRYFYSAADAFLILPWYEPFGITPREAMACGVRVVGADAGGIAHSVVDGETGFLVASRVNRTWRRGRWPASMPSRRCAPVWARGGQARFAADFTWDRVADGLEAAFGELSGPMPAPVLVPARRTGVTRVPASAGFDELSRLLELGRDALAPATARMAGEVADVLAGGGKLIVRGNGGSAADAQHMVTELVDRFLIPGRRGLPAIALCACAATLTAWSNDIGYEDALARERLALGRPEGAILAISTPGLRRTGWRLSTLRKASGCGGRRFWAATAGRCARSATGRSSCPCL